MAKGKVHHWKHGWIPLDAFARAEVAKRESKGSPSVGVPKADTAARQAEAWRIANRVSSTDRTESSLGGAHPAPLDLKVVQDLKGGSADKHLVTDATGTHFTPERTALHNKIINDLVGSARPQDRPAFVMLGGGGASGKTKVAEQAARDFPTAVTINPDDIKMMLPEYKQQKPELAAAFTHEESSYLSKQVTKAAIAKRANIIVDAVGDTSAETVMKKVASAKAAGYGTHARYVSVPTEVAQKRALARGIKTGRYVPPNALAHAHAGVSKVFPEVMGEFDTATLHENVDGMKPVLSTARGKTPTIHDPAAYDAFLKKAKEA